MDWIGLNSWLIGIRINYSLFKINWVISETFLNKNRTT